MLWGVTMVQFSILRPEDGTSSPPGTLAGLFILIILVIISGCLTPEREVSDQISHTLTIACTIPPQAEFIDAITGGDARVIILVPPGASPHSYEPAPSRISELESADLYLYMGSGIEFEERWLERIRGMFPDLPMVNSSASIRLMGSTESHTDEQDFRGSDGDSHSDPHVWLSLINAGIIVNNTCHALCSLNPEYCAVYEKNRDHYLEQVQVADQEIRSSLSNRTSRNILVYHPAFGYFCRDYHLTQVPVEEDGKEPSARQIARLVDMARQANISLIIAEPESSLQGADTISREINASIILISPLSRDYLQNMRLLARSISGE